MNQPNWQSYSVGTVQQVLEQANLAEGLYTQKLVVTDNSGAESIVQFGDDFQPISTTQLRQSGDRVILVTQQGAENTSLVSIADTLRLPTLFWLVFLFLAVVIGVGKKKGFLSILGMIASFLVLLTFIIPQILAGRDPILISLFGCLLIGSVTVYLSHGYTNKSHIAIFSIMSSLVVVAVLSLIAVKTASLFGLGSEEAAFLQVGSTSHINLQGLLLGGIMLGALGVLDDVTVSQVSIVFQLRAAKKSITFVELYQRAIEVGRDHVASLVNTLVLAYAGANMPLFLLFSINKSAPTWVMINNELIAEEIVRTLTGSIGLVLAVPFATGIAASYALKLKAKEVDEMEDFSQSHRH